MSGKKGMRGYPLEVKIAAVKMHLEEGIISKEVMKKFSITNITQLKTWCSKYREFGEAGLVEKRGRPKKGEARQPKSNEEPLWKKVQRLEMENELLKNYQIELRRWSHPELPSKSSKN